MDGPVIDHEADVAQVGAGAPPAPVMDIQAPSEPAPDLEDEESLPGSGVSPPSSKPDVEVEVPRQNTEVSKASVAKSAAPVPNSARANEPVAPGPAGETKASDSFAAVMQRVESAALQWGIRQDDPEGRFVSALLGAIRWSGQISQAAQGEFRGLVVQQEAAAKAEFNRASELVKATNATLTQARSAIINLQIERENLATRVTNETMPLFAAKMQKALTIRVKDESDGLKFRRMLAAGAVTLLVFMGGFVLRTWLDSGQLGALSTCLDHPLAGQGTSQGRIYCDVTSLRAASQ